VLNPGFENDTSGWAAVGSGVVVGRVAGGHSGGWAGVVTNASGHGGCGLDDVPNWVGSTVSGAYAAEFWVRSDGSSITLKMNLGEYQGSTLLGSQQATIKLSTSWQRIAVSYRPVAPGSTLSEQVSVSKASAGTCFYVDDANITVS
jgi:hypothetical protein